uniref:SHSP domain-containing protein n=1 Tax=Meloidogyne javanica TaxID=6303 RepID=A0A915M889_MELJA
MSPLHLFDEFRSTKKHEDFEVEVDVNGFEEREIEVKVFGREVSVRCLHEDQNNRRELNRSYRLPEDVDVNSVESKLSNRGILTIRAAKREPIHHECIINLFLTRVRGMTRNAYSSQTVKNEISRSYVLPTDIDPDSVKSKLSDRGILTVVAYKKA